MPEAPTSIHLNKNRPALRTATSESRGGSQTRPRSPHLHPAISLRSSVPGPHKKKRRPVASGGGFKSLGWIACYPPSLPLPEHTNRQPAQQQQARTILWQQVFMRKAYTQSVNGSNSPIRQDDRIWTRAERKDPKKTAGSL